MRWLTHFFRRRKFRTELDAELRFHVEQKAAELIASGVERGEARRRAMVRLGGMEAIKEEYRESRASYFFESVLQDVRYALRTLRKSPGFTTVAVLTLAFGIGANSAIFSAVNGILLKPLPYSEPSRLVSIRAYKRWHVGGREIVGTVSLPSNIWREVQDQTPGIEGMALCDGQDGTLTGDAAPEIVSAAYVSGDFFTVMGTRPIAGRPILGSDVQADAEPVAVASYGLFRSRWGGSAAALGRPMVLDGRRYTLVGVMPPGFDFGLYGRANGIWVPDVTEGQKGSELPESGAVVARLRKRATIAGVNAELKTISPRFPKVFAIFGGGGYFGCESLVPAFSAVGDPLWILFGAVGLVLLIACANVSGLLLSRGWSRRREIAIRDALGASRGRIARQFLTEGALLALAGGAAGLWLSIWSVRAIRAITPAGASEHGKFLLNMNVLWFTTAVSLLASILFGLGPAVQAASHGGGADLKEGYGGSLGGSAGKRTTKLRSALVVVEVALAVVLVVGATLLGRSLENLISVKPGFRTEHVITLRANFSKSICDPDKTFSSCQLVSEEILDRIRAISGVQDAAAASSAPLTGWSLLLHLRVEGRPQEISLDSGATLARRSVSAGYFRTLGIPILGGRGFTTADVNGSQPVAIVNESLAEKYLAGKPLGKRISTANRGPAKWMEVVGEVRDVRDTSLWEKPFDEVFFPTSQGSYFFASTFIARTSANPNALVPALRRAIWSVDKGAPITGVKTMNQIVSESVAQPRFRAFLLGAFGALGLILAMIGIYGVMSHGVTQRTHEIGIRVALGAQSGDVLRLVVRQGAVLVLAGVAIGLGASAAATRLLRGMLFGISATDPLTLVAVSVALTLAGLAACYVPARRAMRVDPVVALRQE